MFCHPGPPGEVGDPAPPGPPPRPRGYLITRHSQEVNTPYCPEGTTPIWDGYSLLHVMGNHRAHGQDLGMVIYLLVHCILFFVFFKAIIIKIL